MPRVILDTNVIVSAFLKSESNPALILSLFIEGYLSVCLCEDIWTEYREVLKRQRFRKLDHESIEKILSIIREKAIWAVPRVNVNILKSDPADNKFLSCALEYQADYLITGNTKHFPFKKFHGTRIINPKDFIELIGEAISRK
ncbi:MAG: putative toxin-antitoxin system toxin component, PIN family [Thermodesulfobacteriota bacterium]